MPFPAFVVRPSAGKKGDGKKFSILFKRTHITVARLRRKTRFPGKRPFHHVKKGVVIAAGVAAASRLPFPVFLPGIIRKGPGPGPGNLKERLPFRRVRHAVAHDSGQISRRSGMLPFQCFARFVREGQDGIQPVRGHEKRIRAADFLRFLVHFCCKAQHRISALLRRAFSRRISICFRICRCFIRFFVSGELPSDMFRDDHGGIIVGLQHQGIQEILQPEHLSCPRSKVNLRHACRIGGDRDILLRVCQLQRKNTCHDLRGAGHGKYLGSVFLQ